ncbi:hypothetical protein BHM03_00037658 [Ensete ventricosum]|nr:hypothetical protein BHM03_00037658 [Ensete ventricosum]
MENTKGDRRRGRGRSARAADDIAAVLRKCWYRLRLSVRDPSRVPTWDAIVLTAASPEQAALYEWQLRRAKRFGRIAPSTVTLHAIYALARHLLRIGHAPLEMSLYEDLVSAWVPAKHEWLRSRPLGEELINALGNQKMFSFCACMSL